jgi:hypothetical protein
VLRGKLVRTRLFCEDIPPPPSTVVAAVSPVSPTATTRQRSEQHVSNDSCRYCHQQMDPIGFGLEEFDGFGEHRTQEAGQPIDDSGQIVGTDIRGAFSGGVELATRLALSQQVGACAAKQLTRFALGHLETDPDQCTVSLTLSRYTGSNGSLYSALEGIVESDAFVQRTVAP